MKFLHLSDLHIGKSVNGFPMADEIKNSFRQVCECVVRESADAVVIAGDIYDRASPSADSVALFDDFLTELAGLGTAVMIVPGNHDSHERISYLGRLIQTRRLFVCGAFAGKAERITVPDRYGAVNFWLLPFIKPMEVKNHFAKREISTYYDAVEAALASSGIDYAERNALVSHQFYTKSGVVSVRSESEQNPVGGLDAVDASLIDGFDYSALGHLHGAQSVGTERIRYSGSPVKYSLSEINQKKSITVVGLMEKGNVSIETVPIIPLREMRELRGELSCLIGYGSLPPEEREDYLYVTLTDEQEIIDPIGKLRSVYPNVMALGFDNSRSKIELSGIEIGSAAAGALSPYELFSRFFFDANGCEMTVEQAEIVKGLME